MIITNGFIKVIYKETTAIDPNTGYPVPVANRYKGLAIPAQIYANNSSLKGISQGEAFTVSKYTVIVDNKDFWAEQIEVVLNGVNIGEFSVTRIEPLTYVNKTKITI